MLAPLLHTAVAMRRATFPKIILGTFVTILLCSLSVQAQVKLAGQNCEIESDLKDLALTQMLTEEADQMVPKVNRFFEMLGFSKMPEGKKVRIKFFNNVEKMKSQTSMAGHQDVNMQGFFDHSTHQIGITYLGNRDEAKRLLVHEFAHLVLHAQGEKLAPWVDEGFADFISRDSDTLEFFETKKIPAVTQTILQMANAQGQLPSIDDLAKTSHTQFYGKDQDIRYAFSVAIMAYVLNQQGPRIFGNFVRAVSQGANPREWMNQNVDPHFEEHFKTWMLGT